MATKGRPFTFRLRPEVERRLEEEAERARRPKTVMLESLADEAMRTRRFSGIGFRGPDHDRRAWVMGTGLDVWEMIELHQDGGEKILDNHPISRRQLEVSLAYYEEYPAGIDRHLRQNARTPREWYELYPGIAPPPPGE